MVHRKENKMKLERFVSNVWYKQPLILIDDYCNKIISATASELWTKGGYLLERQIDVFQANTKGEIVITLRKER
jgi:hypothetical protein